MAVPVGMVFDVMAIDRASAVFARIGAAADASAGRLESVGFALGKFAAVGGLAAAAVGVFAVKMAADFQTATNQLVTSAGETEANLGLVRKGLLEMAGQVGVSATELAKGMYQVESAGYHGAKGLDVMRAAAEGAKAEGANMETVANALTTVMSNYGKAVQDNAVKGTDFLVASVSLGKTRMEDFAGSISNVLPVAKMAGISLGEVGGAMATMTAQGISSDQAATYLRQTIVRLADQTPKAKNEMKALGLESIDVAGHLGQRGLAGTLQVLTDAIAKHLGPQGLVMLDSLKHAGQNANQFQIALSNLPPAAQTYIGALTTMVGGQKTMMGALSLTGDHMKTFVDDTASINNAMDKSGAHVNGWSIVQGSFNQKLSQFKAGAGAMAIEVGTKLLPALTAAFGWLADKGLPAIKRFGDMLGGLGVIIRSVYENRDPSDLLQGIFPPSIIDLVSSNFRKVHNAFVDGFAAIKDVFTFVGDHTGTFGLLATILGTAAVGFGLMTAAIGAYTIVSDAAIAIQLAWNGAMLAFDAAWAANPIGLVVIGIAALVAGLVFAYKHFHAFHSIVDTVAQALKTAAIAVAKFALAIPGFFVRMYHDVTGFVDRMYQDVTGFFARMGSDVAGFSVRIYQDVTGWFSRMWADIVKIGDSIGKFVSEHWRLLLAISTAGVGLIYILVQDHWKAVSGFFARMYNDVTGFVGRMYADTVGFFSRMAKDISGFASRMWGDVTGWVSKMWNDVTGYFTSKGQEASNTATGVSTAVGNSFSRLWETVTGFVARMWHDVTGFFVDMASAVWSVVSPMVAQVIGSFMGLYNGSVNVARDIWSQVTGFFGSMSSDVVNIFNGLVASIGRIWNLIKDIMATPIRWVIENVYDAGIVPIFNAIAGVLHEDGMKLNTLKFAEGGVVPGNHNRDTVPIYATPGEVVVPTSAVARAGGPDALMSALGFGGGGGAGGHYFLGGGVLSNIGSGIGHAAGAVGHAVGSAVSGIAGMVRGAMGSMISPAVHEIESLADATLGGMGGMGNIMSRSVHEIGDSMINWVTGQDTKDTSAAASYGGQPGGAGGAAQWAPLVAQAAAMLGLPMSVIPGVLSLINSESGGRADAINLTDSNAAAGHPSRGLMQCVSLATTILTRRGWLRHDEVAVGDETIGYNPKTGRSEWTRISKVVKYDDEVVWRVGHKGWHADVTPNHRWWSDTAAVISPESMTTCPECGYKSSPRGVSTHRGRKHKLRTIPATQYRGEFIRTEDFAKQHRIRLAAAADTDGIPGLSVEDAQVIAWLQGDGHIRRAEHGRGWDGVIFQSKMPMVVKLRALLSHIEHGYSVRPARGNATPGHVFRLRRAYVTDLLKRAEVMETGPEAFVLRLSPDQRAAWLGAMIDAEGHRQPGKQPGWGEFVRIAQVNGPLQDAIRLAVYLEGFRPTYSANRAEKDGYQPAGTIGMAHPHVAPSTFHKPEILDRQSVWCVKTDLETWTACLDGQVFVTGNTIPTTFEAYRNQALPDNIVDPLANIYAGMNYAFRNYGVGMLMAGGRHGSGGGYVGYENGTSYVPQTGPAILHQGEAVLTARENASRGRSGPTVNLSGTFYSYDPHELANAQERKLRNALALEGLAL